MSNKTSEQLSIPNWLQKTALGLCLICFCLPYIVTSDLIFPHITGRNFLFRGIVSLGAGVVVLSCIYYKDIVRDKISLALIGLLGAKVISMLLSDDMYHSFYSSLVRMDGVLSWFYLIGFYFLLRVVFLDRQSFLFVLRYTTILATLSVVYIIIRWLGDTSVTLDRQTFTFGNPAFFGVHMLFHVGFSLYLFVSDRSSFWRIIWAVSFVLCLGGLMMSGTRASILGVSVVSLVLLVYMLRDKVNAFSWSRVVGMLLLLSITVIGLYVKSGKTISNAMPSLERIQSTTLDQKEIRSRFAAWKAGWEGWKANPIFGNGECNFESLYQQYNKESNVDNWIDNSHNHIIETLTANGIVGLAVYLVLLVLVVKRLFFSNEDNHHYILGGILVAWFIQNLFIFDTINSYLYLMLLIAISASVDHKIRKNEAENIKFGILQLIPISLIAVVLTWCTNIDAYRSAKMIKKSDSSLSIDDFKKSLSTDNYSNKEATVFLLAHMQTILRSEGSEDDKLEAVEFGLSATERQLLKTPNDIRLLLLSTRLYYSVKGYKPEYLDKSITLITRAKKYAPYRKDVSNLYDKIVRSKG